MIPAMKSFAARFVLAAVVVIPLAHRTLAQGPTIAVVVSPKNALASLSLGELRKIFSGDKRSWPDGTRIKLFSRGPGTPERAALLKLLGKSETEYKQYWAGKVYQGEAESEPMVLPSVGVQKEALKAYPGAIALFDSADVKADMKVVKVDGKLPEDSGYPLNR